MACSKAQPRWNDDSQAKWRRINDRGPAFRDSWKQSKKGQKEDSSPTPISRKEERQTRKMLAELHVQAHDISCQMNEAIRVLQASKKQGSKQRDPSGSTRHPGEDSESSWDRYSSANGGDTSAGSDDDEGSWKTRCPDLGKWSYVGGQTSVGRSGEKGVSENIYRCY